MYVYVYTYLDNKLLQQILQFLIINIKRIPRLHRLSPDPLSEFHLMICNKNKKSSRDCIPIYSFFRFISMCMHGCKEIYMCVWRVYIYMSSASRYLVFTYTCEYIYECTHMCTNLLHNFGALSTNMYTHVCISVE